MCTNLNYCCHHKFDKTIDFFLIFFYMYNILHASFYIKYMRNVIWTFTEKILRDRWREFCRRCIESDSCERSTGEIERSLESRCKYHSCDNNHPRRLAATVLVIILPKRHVIPTTPTDRDKYELRGRYWPSRRCLYLSRTCDRGGMEATERGFFLRTTTTCPAVFTIRPGLWPRRRKFRVIAVVTGSPFYEHTDSHSRLPREMYSALLGFPG